MIIDLTPAMTPLLEDVIVRGHYDDRWLHLLTDFKFARECYRSRRGRLRPIRQIAITFTQDLDSLIESVIAAPDKPSRRTRLELIKRLRQAAADIETY